MEEEEVILEIEDSTVPCKKKLLIENSEYFRAMFSGNFLESTQNRIKIKDVNLNSIKNILMFLWDHTYIIKECDLLPLLRAALMLQFPKIQKYCEHRISENLKPSNCLNVWKNTDQQVHPLDLKAKCMALEEFREICITEQILELDINEICVYLGHTSLRVDSELTVFQTVMKWWYENSKNYQDPKPTDAILKLLHCVNFKNVTKQNINEMKTYPDIHDNEYIQSLLNCLSCIKEQSDLSQFSEEIQGIALKFLNDAKQRVVLESPCIILECVILVSGQRVHQSDVFFRDRFGRKRKYTYTNSIDTTSQSMLGLLFDPVTETMKNFFSIDENKCKGLTGFEILSYKEFILLFGGEVSFGNGNWNSNLWMFDSFRDKWERRTVLPHCRRHFETCIVETYLFVVGGTGQFRVVQDNLFYYDIKKDIWSTKIALPCSSRQIKCCRLNDKLFILSLANQSGYVFNKNSQNFKSIPVVIEKSKLDRVEGEYEIFFWKEDFYIIGSSLTKFKLKDDKLIFQCSQKVLDSTVYFFKTCVMCNDILFIISTDNDNEQHYLNILKLNDFSDLRTINLSEQVFPHKFSRICAFHHYDSVKNNVLVNDF